MIQGAAVSYCLNELLESAESACGMMSSCSPDFPGLGVGGVTKHLRLSPSPGVVLGGRRAAPRSHGTPLLRHRRPHTVLRRSFHHAQPWAWPPLGWVVGDNLSITPAPGRRMAHGMGGSHQRLCNCLLAGPAPGRPSINSARSPEIVPAHSLFPPFPCPLNPRAWAPPTPPWWRTLGA